ncbi:MAG: hypothetical protein JWR77_1666 [Rhizorhabdus sp.]|nr:hypothetical protein [Rhizorhabdus sp.]
MDLDDFLRRPERWASILGWATLAGIEFGLIGPFGSYAANLFTRICYWTVLFWIGSLLLWPSVVAALFLGPRRGFPPLFAGVAVVLIACIPLAALGAAETYLFWPVRASGMKTLEWYGLTIIVALPAVSGLVWLELRKTGIMAARSSPAPAGAPNAVAHEISESVAPTGPVNPPALPDHVLHSALCLQMEDHHVRVHMHARSHLHFAVMRHVVAAMDEARGLQVHRSWWVARTAVRGWHREGRSVTLVLINGLRVPVARNRVAILRAQGWLREEECLSRQVAVSAE